MLSSTSKNRLPSIWIRRQRYLLALILLYSASLVGCGVSSPGDTGELRRLLQSFQPAGNCPIAFSEITIDHEHPSKSDPDQFEVQFRATGACLRTTYAEIDQSKLFAVHPSLRDMSADQMAIQRISDGLQYLHRDEADRIKRLPGRYEQLFRLVSQEGESFGYLGFYTAKKTDGKWEYKNLSLKCTSPARTVGYTYFHEGGKWRRERSVSHTEVIHDAKRPRVLQYLDGSGRAEFDVDGGDRDLLPDGSYLIDLEDPKSIESLRAERKGFIDAASAILMEAAAREQKLKVRLSGLFQTGTTWSFVTQTAGGEDREWTLESSDFDDTSMSFVAIIRAKKGLKWRQFDGAIVGVAVIDTLNNFAAKYSAPLARLTPKSNTLPIFDDPKLDALPSLTIDFDGAAKMPAIYFAGKPVALVPNTAPK